MRWALRSLHMPRGFLFAPHAIRNLTRGYPDCRTPLGTITSLPRPPPTAPIQPSLPPSSQRVPAAQEQPTYTKAKCLVYDFGIREQPEFGVTLHDAFGWQLSCMILCPSGHSLSVFPCWLSRV
jgi:hypothetical protein